MTRLDPARVLLALAACCAGLAPAAASTPVELFQAGNGAYEQGKYKEAAEAYRKILEYGVADPRVQYNYANAQFKMGNIGEAILGYERVLKLAPGDRDARDNLDLARGLIRDRIEEAPVPYPVEAIRQILDTLSVDGLAGLFLVLYFAAAGCLGAWPLAEGETRRRLLGYGAAGLGLCAILAGSSLAYTIHQRDAPRAIVMTDKVDVLSGPGQDNTVLFTVHEGTRLEMRNRREGWIQVSLPNAMSGWVPAASVESV